MSYRQWPVPHNARLEKSIETGQLLTIKGRIAEFDPKENEEARMVINLSGDERSCEKIPLHMSFRFKEKEVVLNSFENGEWQKEERKKLPWKPGEQFDLRLRCHGDHFEIMADQKDWAKFEYRLPLTQVTHLFIDGPISLDGVQWGGKYYNVPYECGISGGFTTGKRLFVTGAPEKKSDGFSVNLVKQDGTVALHFNPRFGEKKVVRNSFENNGWGNEEREATEFPFKKDVAFDLVIVNEQYSYQIYVNDERFCTFAHRVDPNTISGLKIEGDVELQSIHVA